MTSVHKSIVVLSLIGAAGLAVILWGLLAWLDGWPGPIPDAGERIQLALKLAVGPVAFLVVVVQTVALCRLLTGAVDPLDDDAPRWRRVDMRVLSNTVEQTLIFLPLFLATAIVIRADESAWLPALAMAFVLGRIVFWIGYRQSTLSRAPGMSTAFYINLGMLGFVVARFLG